MLALPQPIAAYFAADRGKGETVAASFTADAVVKDEGHTYRGTDEIRQWRSDVASKFTYTCEPLAMKQAGDKTVVTCRLEGDFPGSPVDLRFFFMLANDKVAELEIVP